MKRYLKLMRIHHYLKNGLIFLPLIFGGKVLEISLLRKSILGFLTFSFIASVIYIINDIKDVDEDRNHPTKRNRPIASGAISKKNAIIVAFLLFITAAAINFYIIRVDMNSWMFLVLYIATNIIYSFGCKNIPLVDIGILALGFLVRVLYGGAVTGIEVSAWLYLTIISMSFYLSLGKRRNEIKKNGVSARKVLRHYTKDFLDKNMYMCLALTIVFYSMWAVNPNTIAAQSGGSLIWTVPLVMIICMKYSMSIEGDSYGDPVDVVLNDKVLMGLITGYGISVFMTLYGHTMVQYIGGTR